MKRGTSTGCHGGLALLQRSRCDRCPDRLAHDRDRAVRPRRRDLARSSADPRIGGGGGGIAGVRSANTVRHEQFRGGSRRPRSCAGGGRHRRGRRRGQFVDGGGPSGRARRTRPRDRRAGRRGGVGAARRRRRAQRRADQECRCSMPSSSGSTASFDYARLTVATTALLAGARLVATNTDSTFPTPHGLVPGGGSIVAAVSTASGASPMVGGKPHRPMADLIAEILTVGRGAFDPDRTLMVGDRPRRRAVRRASRLPVRAREVRCARRRRTEAGVPVDLDVADLAAVARVLMAGG